MAQRVPIRGEAGIGYVLEAGFDLPPLMLTTDEVEAIALGAQWVIAHADEGLARAALDVLAKIAAIVPEDLRPVIDDPAVGTPPARARRNEGSDIGAADPAKTDSAPTDLAKLRRSCRQGCKLIIDYVDEIERATTRTIRPFMVGYVATCRTVMAWCELRQDFRIFRTDRLAGVEFLDERYPEQPTALRRRWLALLRRKVDRDARSIDRFRAMLRLLLRNGARR